MRAETFVGFSDTSDFNHQHAFIWSRGRGMIDIGALGIASNGQSVSIPAGVNDSGQVVGNSLTSDDKQHAFSWTAKGGMIDLGAPCRKSTSSTAVAVNANGQVLGYCYSDSLGSFRAFVWSEADGMIDLGTLGGTSTMPAAISDRGQVVGISDTGKFQSRFQSPFHAFSWTAAAGMVDLDPSGRSRAVALNAAGQIVGSRSDAEEKEHAFIWTADGGTIDLGEPAGVESKAMAINANGQVVGTLRRTETDPSIRPFSWTAATGMIQLGTTDPPGDGVEAVALNSSGRVVGFSATFDEKVKALIWETRAAHATIPARADTYVRAGVFASKSFGDRFTLRVKKAYPPTIRGAVTARSTSRMNCFNFRLYTSRLPVSR